MLVVKVIDTDSTRVIEKHGFAANQFQYSTQASIQLERTRVRQGQALYSAGGLLGIGRIGSFFG